MSTTRARIFVLGLLLAPVVATAQNGGTVAVEAFTDITGAPGDAWIGAGIVETLITGLQGRPGFEVVRRAGPDAQWVLSGAYQRAGNQIRITARLVDVATGAVIRSVRVDGAMEDLFDLQDRLVAELERRPQTPPAVVPPPGPAVAPAAPAPASL